MLLENTGDFDYIRQNFCVMMRNYYDAAIEEDANVYDGKNSVDGDNDDDNDDDIEDADLSDQFDRGQGEEGGK